MDPIKRAIARAAFKAFQDGTRISTPDGPIEYEPLRAVSDLALEVKVQTGNGPRVFEIRVKEVM